jgi:hypothetical protein
MFYFKILFLLIFLLSYFFFLTSTFRKTLEKMDGNCLAVFVMFWPWLKRDSAIVRKLMDGKTTENKKKQGKKIGTRHPFPYFLFLLFGCRVEFQFFLII